MANIGIFWVYKGKVTGKIRDFSEGVRINGRFDSPDDHVKVWATDPVFRRLRAEGMEYEDNPRGRLVWQQTPELSVIYMDKKLLRSESAKKKVAAFFDLDPAAVQWESDAHYTTDPAEKDRLLY